MTPARSGRGLRAVHALTFTAFAAAATAAVWPELVQLWAGLAHRYHPGTPPAPLAVGAFVLALAGVLALLISFVRGRSAPLWASVLPMLAFALGLAVQGHQVASRSPAGANARLLEQGHRVHLAMRDRLQKDFAVPTEAAPWSQTLGDGPSEFRSRAFRALPYRVQLGQGEPSPVPGSVLVAVSPDGVGFELRFVGLDDALSPTILRDASGEPVVLRAVFNPDGTSP